MFEPMPCKYFPNASALGLGAWPPAGLQMAPSGKPYCSDPQIPPYSSDPTSDFQLMMQAGGCDNSEAPNPGACLQQMVNEVSWGWRPTSLDPIAFCNSGAARTFGSSAYVIPPGTPLPAPQPMSAVYPQALLTANAAKSASPAPVGAPASTGPQNQAVPLATPSVPLSSYYPAPPASSITVNSSGAVPSGSPAPASSGLDLSSIPWWGWGIAVVGLMFAFGGKH